MASETQVGKLVIDLQIKTQALEKGLDTAKKKLQEIEQQNEETQKTNKALDTSFVAMSVSIVASLRKINGIMKDSINEYKQYKQSMSSLQDVSDYTGQSMSDLTDIMKKYENVMEKSDLATTIKNFSLMGMKAEETDKMIQALTDSAIKNRNANYTVSEAVRVASEGYRQGLSTLSDSAGVTENLSVMLDNYAKSIGKTASQLTEEEINQAYVNRTMAAAAPFAGAMTEYLDSLAGKQGEYSQALRETKVAYAEALEPTLVKFEEFKTRMVSGLGEIISENKSATLGITAFIVTLGTLSVGILAVKKAYDMYTKSAFAAAVAQEGLNTAIKDSPLGFILSLISAIVGMITTYISATKTQKSTQEELTRAQEEYNKVLEGTIELNEENTSKMTQVKEELEKYLNLQKEQASDVFAIKEINRMIDTEQDKEKLKEWKKVLEEVEAENHALYTEMEETSDSLKKKLGIQEKGILTEEKAEKALEAYTKRIKESNAITNIKTNMDIESTKAQQQEAAGLEQNARRMEKYLNIVKKGNTSTKEYQKAVKELATAYPEAVKKTADGQELIIDRVEDCVVAEKARADQEWNNSQKSIQGKKEEISIFIDLARAAENDAVLQQKLAKIIGLSYEDIIPTLTSVLNVLNAIGSATPWGVLAPDTKKVKIPKISGGGHSKGSKASKSYENKKLDNYIKLIEYKKSLDKISLQQEIKMYQTALNKYAKTTDEKRSLRTKIYELNKELAQKEKALLDQQTEDYEVYIQKQKNLRGSAYDLTEQTKDYDKIIAMHQKYLKKIMKDKRLSLDERKELYREELQTVRDYEQQKRDLMVEQIDNTVSQLTNAITKQLEEAQEREKEAIDKNLEEVEKWKDARIDAINEEYDARIEAIEKELEALDKAEKQKTRDEEDAEHEKKRERLEELIAFEHDATTKANYQKELDKLLEEYKKTLDKRALDDKKEALNEQKELLKEEQNNKTQAIEDEAEKQKEIYETQLEELEKYYDEQTKKAQETAEKMLLNVQKNQDKILELLKKYGDAYEITGQSLGEKIAQGIDKGLTNKIKGIIQKIQDTIDANIEAKVKEWTRSNYKYEASANKPKQTNINITQQNYIEQNPEMPSETYRKLNNISEKLAEEIEGL